MQALIGYTGLIGQLLYQQLNFDHCFTSVDIEQLSNFNYDTVYCSAPSGNRIVAEQDPEKDVTSTDKLIDALLKTNTNRIVLISTCDTQVSPDSHYGKNRLRLETAVKSNWSNYHIVRLSSLIHPTIKKNILYDIRTRQFLDKINPNTQLQWYPLDNIVNDLNWCINNEIREINLCSEPIVNQQIIELFGQHIKHLILNRPAGRPYNLTPYRYTQAEIFNYMQEYFQ